MRLGIFLLVMDELLFRRILYQQFLSGFLKVCWSASFILLDGEIIVFKIASSIPYVDIRLFVFIFLQAYLFARCRLISKRNM